MWRPSSFPSEKASPINASIPLTKDDGQVELLGEGEITWGNYHPYTH